MTQEEKDRIDATYRNPPRTGNRTDAVVGVVADVVEGVGHVTIGLLRWVIVFPIVWLLLSLMLAGLGTLGFLLALIISIYVLK